MAILTMWKCVFALVTLSYASFLIMALYGLGKPDWIGTGFMAFVMLLVAVCAHHEELLWRKGDPEDFP